MKEDTLKAYLRNAVLPFTIVDSSGAMLDSAFQYADFRFENAINGIYYISIKHRNSIKTCI